MKGIFAGIGFVAGLAAGFACGWAVRKRCCEVDIEEISEEELEKMLNDASDKTDMNTDDAKETAEEDNDEKYFANSVSDEDINKMKEMYFKKWKESAKEYDTQTKEEPADVVVTTNDDSNMKEAIEYASLSDWNHWNTTDDGEYDTESIYWNPIDDSVRYDDGEPVGSLGFDIAEVFNNEKSVSSISDARVVVNNKKKVAYYIEMVEPETAIAPDEGDDDDGDYDDDARQWIYRR